MNPKIQEKLKSSEFDYKLYPHSRNTSRCEDSAVERSVELYQTLKCMLAKNAQETIVALLLRGDHKLKIKRVRSLLNQAVDLLTDKEIIGLNLSKGAISPLLLPSRCHIIIDEAVLATNWITFSAGQHDLGIGMFTKDLICLIGPADIGLIRSTSNS